MISLTPKQASAIAVRVTASCTTIELTRVQPGRLEVEANYFERVRLIETVRVQPGGAVRVLA